jgi:hypothetical protein
LDGWDNKNWENFFLGYMILLIWCFYCCWWWLISIWKSVEYTKWVFLSQLNFLPTYELEVKSLTTYLKKPLEKNSNRRNENCIYTLLLSRSTKYFMMVQRLWVKYLEINCPDGKKSIINAYDNRKWLLLIIRHQHFDDVLYIWFFTYNLNF